MDGYRTYTVSARDREPLIAFLVEGLEEAGCRILYRPAPDQAPFRITFETPVGERMGVVAYAFLANSRPTRNRPADEHRFQLKYGKDEKVEHELWQDPYGLYTTILLGINPEAGFFVAADPVLHSPTKFFISVEFKDDNVQEIVQHGWASWERLRRGPGGDEPVEILVGGKREKLLQFIRFERAAKGMAPGPRQLLAEKLEGLAEGLETPGASSWIHLPSEAIGLSKVREHQLAEELQLDESQILDLILSAPRLKMAVRGWVAEEHLRQHLALVPGIQELERLEEDKGPDLRLRYRGSRPLTIECKNVLRRPAADGSIRLDFQRTRASKADPCSRFYQPGEFDLLAACLHSRTEKWEFRYKLPTALAPHRTCKGRLDNRVTVGDGWLSGISDALEAALLVP